MLYVSHIQRRVGLGRNLPLLAPSAPVILCHHSNCQWEKCTVYVRAHVRQSYHHNFPHFTWQPSCWHPCTAALGTRGKPALRTQTSTLVCFFDEALVSPSFPNPPLSNILGEHWLKLFPPWGTIHQGCTWAIKNLKAGVRSLLCLPMRSKAAHQTADKTWVKREYFIHSCQRKGGVRY